MRRYHTIRSGFAGSLSIILCLAEVGGSGPVAAQQVQTPEPEETKISDVPAQLVIPVRPLGDAEQALVNRDILQDSYITLQDGAVLSLREWILGNLNKSDVGVGMDDVQTRLFLGQVARAMTGDTRPMVGRAPVMHQTPQDYARFVGLDLKLAAGPFSSADPAVGAIGNSGGYTFGSALHSHDLMQVSFGTLQLSENPFSTAFDRVASEMRIRGRVLSKSAPIQSSGEGDDEG